MAGYYIQGLLNTETAWDSYCIYGYKSDIDKRYFCAVQTSNIFYASRRESAYIDVQIYCKGQQVSTLKCISNTGSEYDVSVRPEITSDPTVTKVYSHDVWSNMNGRQVTMADFISNAPILNGVDLSDAERDALAINYLNNVPEPYGQGTATITIKKPGQTLNFASRLLSKTVSQYISGDVTIDIQDSSSDWEILFEYQFGSSSGYALINSLLEAHDFGKSGSPTWNIEGDLIKCVEQTLSALKAIDGRTGNSGSFPSSFSSYSIDDVISSSFGSAYERITIVKKSSVNLPFEVGFHWQVGSSGQAALLKSDGSFVTWSQIYYQGTGGNYITMGQSNNWSNIAFSGTIKVYEFFPSNGESDNGSWQTYDGSVAQSHSMTGCFIVFAIPS